MKNQQKIFIIPVLIVVLVVVIIDLYVRHTATPTGVMNATTTVSNNSGQANDANNPAQTQCQPALTVTSISQSARVAFPVSVKGVINNDNSKDGCSWQMFEGQAGTAQLYFNADDKGWNKVGASVPVNVENWMATSSPFSVTLTFNNSGIGLPSGTPMRIEFVEEDASGSGNSATIEFPIVLK